MLENTVLTGYNTPPILAGSSAGEHVKRLCRQTHLRLRVLSLARAFGPFLSFLSLAIMLALSGLPALIPPPIALMFACLIYIGTGVTLALAIIRLDWPGWDAACRIIDNLSEGDPASSQFDRPAQNTQSAHILWQAHQERMSVLATGIATPRFTRQWTQLDPFYLRFVLPILCGAMFLYAGQNSLARLYSALTPDPGALFGAHNVKIEAWVVPPVYTGYAPLVLKTGTLDAKAPEGSEITMRISAPRQPRLRLRQNGQTQTLRPQRGDDGVYEVKTILQDSFDMALLYWGERARFNLTGLADNPPVARITQQPESDKTDRVNFGWSGHDDYGIAKAELLIRYQDSEPVSTPLSLSALEPRDTSDTVYLDLTRHVFAGQLVSMQIRLTDAKGQTGLSEAINFTLPEKLFLDQVAKAITEIRKEILITQEAYAPVPPAPVDQAMTPERANWIEYAPDQIKRAGLMLEALTYAPTGYMTDILVFLGLRHAHATLNAVTNLPEAKTLTEDVLWRTALRAELGNLANVKRALDAAAEALEQALRDGASEAEVERLIATLEQAIERYLQALLARAQSLGEADNNASENALSTSEFEDMLKALQELSEAGARDQARQLLSDLSRLLDSLENAQISQAAGPGQGGGPSGEPNSESSSKAQQMEDLSGLLRDQRELNDETFSRSRSNAQSPSQSRGRNRNNPSSPSPKGQDPGQGTQPSQQNGEDKGFSDLAEKQEDLTERLEALRQTMREGESDSATRTIDEMLGQALEAQKQAEQALRDGDNETARAAQRETAANLREAITSLAENVDSENAENAQSDTRDPLGRPTGRGTDIGDNIDIPDKMERMRAREFLNELRRRSGLPSLSPAEREYLDRLLRRF